MTSLDWGGYSVVSDLSSPQPLVTGVNASWTVPSVDTSGADSYSATWIGIGGQFDETLIQMGTEQDSVGGQGQYSAWYELLPSDAVMIDALTVSPGDVVAASISLLDPTANIWSVAIIDFTNGQSFQKSLQYDSSMLSAEWIVERPTINNRIRTLADFGQVSFTACKATVGGTVGTITSFPSTRITMYNRQNLALVSVSAFSSDGSSFTVQYLD